MIINTKAVVFSTLKYGEADLIVRCYTESSGLKSYLLHNILKSRKGKLKVSFFQPLTLLELEVIHKDKGTLERINEAKVLYLYKTLHTQVVKSSMVIFIAETLTNSIQEATEDPALFQFLKNSLIWLDNNRDIANFHILFLLNLTKYLGFYPEAENKSYAYFDLREGVFANRNPLNNSISGEKLNLFKSLIGINFDVIGQLGFNSRSRNIMLDILLDYYELHLPGFKKPKSLNVLKEVFR